MKNIWNDKRLLVIGMVWPEPGSSAAGSRMLQLLNWFLDQGMQLQFACAAGKSEFSFDLPSLGIKEEHIVLNDSNFDSQLALWNPDIVLFDRFMIEEQYGWRVAQVCPDALRLLDTEDLHFLRHARQECFKKGIAFSSAQLFTDRAKREIASIYRCDASFIISEYEMKLLQEQFQIPAKLLYYLPFMETSITTETLSGWPTFEERADFVFIGNFIHEPNWNAVQVLKSRIWPGIRKRLPTVNIHIYGAYATDKVMQLHKPQEGFYVHGRALTVLEVLSPARVLLAPIQFGAGVKGKFVDAMKSGTPCVTTEVGAEGMNIDLNWNGYIAVDDADFIDKAVFLYSNSEDWSVAQQQGSRILNERYAQKGLSDKMKDWLIDVLVNKQNNRDFNFVGQMLLHHTLQSTKYMSLWIEEKNKE